MLQGRALSEMYSAHLLAKSTYSQHHRPLGTGHAQGGPSGGSALQLGGSLLLLAAGCIQHTLLVPCKMDRSNFDMGHTSGLNVECNGQVTTGSSTDHILKAYISDSCVHRA